MLYPKIGIRPVIDGRWGGIRESLEEQTMGMAKAAKALIETLRYPDGTPVQVVIAPARSAAARKRRPARTTSAPRTWWRPDRDPLLVLRHGDL